MAQTGYTPILIYSSSTGGNAPSAGSLTNSTLGSELAINITDGKLFYKDNANNVQVIGWKTVPVSAGGTGLTATPTNGQLPIGNGTGYTLAALTAGTGIAVTNGAGSITVATNGQIHGGAPVTTATDYTVAAGVTWVINNKSGSSMTLTLPTASTNVGREITVQNYQAQTVVSASSNVVPQGGGAAGTAILLDVVGNWATLVSDGTNWVIMAAAAYNNLLLE
jgi:hypothetical protein